MTNQPECAKDCWVCRDGLSLARSREMLASMRELAAGPRLRADLMESLNWLLPRMEHHVEVMATRGNNKLLSMAARYDALYEDR